MAGTNIPIIVQGNSFNLAIPLQIYVIQDNEMVLQDYTPLPTDDVSIQLKGCRRNYTYTPTIEDNVAKVYLTGNELADNYSIVVSIVKANGERLRSFRTDQFFIVESSDDLTQADIIEGLEDNVIYLQPQYFIAGEDGRGIISVTKTATSGLVDTYTITYTDNTTSTFQVTNGALQPVIVDIEGDVTNAPDEEDLTSVNNGNHDVLKFNDKAYMPTIASGMGRKYLRKNFVNGINKLTQAMVADANTIYHIQYDYDLNGATITMPAGATLKFEGGSLKNGTLVGNDCIIDGDADIRCGITGVKNDVTHLKWFTKENDKNTAFARALACAGTTILDGDNTPITLTQTVTFAKANTCDLRNLNINFTASANGQNMFLFDSDTNNQGTTKNITHCTFTLTNPTAYQNVHCLHLRRWYNNVRSEINDVYVKDFSGYMFVCESYLQEMNFVRFKGNNVGGFVSFNREYGTANAFGDKGQGSSNILSFTQCGIDGSLNGNTTITDVVSVTKIILCSFDSCVFQGATNGVVSNTYYFTSYNTMYLCEVKAKNTWSEFSVGGTSFTAPSNNCCITEYVNVDSNARFAMKYTFSGVRNSLTTELHITSVEVGVDNLFDIASDAYPTIRLTPNSALYHFPRLVELYRNKCNLIIDVVNTGYNNLAAKAGYYREGSVVSMLDDIRSIEVQNVKNYFIYEDGIRILRQYATSGTGPLYFGSLATSQRYRYIESGKRAYFHLIYRVYPLIEVTSSNLGDFSYAGLENGIGIFQNSRFNPFVAGQSLTPSDNVWREVITQVSPTISTPFRYSHGRWGMDIAVCDIIDGTYPLEQNIIIDSEDNTKLINLTNTRYDYGTTADAPVLGNYMQGHRYFDTSIGKPTFWSGTKWLTADGIDANLTQKGTTAQRPTTLDDTVVSAGFKFWDTDLNRQIYWLTQRTTLLQINASPNVPNYKSNPCIEGNLYRFSIPTVAGQRISFATANDGTEQTIEISCTAGVGYAIAPSATTYPFIKFENGSTSGRAAYVQICGKWIEADGATAGVKRNGDTASRPASSGIYTGFTYWDTDLGKMIAWNGSAWVNLDGSALS